MALLGAVAPYEDAARIDLPAAEACQCAARAILSGRRVPRERTRLQFELRRVAAQCRAWTFCAVVREEASAHDVLAFHVETGAAVGLDSEEIRSGIVAREDAVDDRDASSNREPRAKAFGK